MAKYRLLWIDDDWEASKTCKTLSLAANLLDERLATSGLDVEITKKSTVSMATIELARPDVDYRLVIVDLQYDDDHHEKYHFGLLGEKLGKKGIPFVIFSRFLGRADEILVEISVTHLLVGKFTKDESSFVSFAETIVGFLNAPPVRLLHLSDLHFNSKLIEGIDAEEQAALFSNLIKCIREENENQKFDSVIITGDLSASDPRNDLIAVRDIIQEIVESTITKNNKDRLCIIPGNHDICWDDFGGKKLAKRPLEPFLEFYNAIFGHSRPILSEIKAWDRSKELLRHECICDDLSWFRRLPSSRLSVIGLGTPSLEKQGRGVFSREHQKFLNDSWSDNRPKNEIRIALMHHNIFASLSLNRRSETYVLENSGEAMYELMSRECSLVLTGHTHAVNFMRCNANKLGAKGFTSMANLDVLSGGTIGGHHNTLDRPSSYNIIEFSHIMQETNKRDVKITAFLYDSDTHIWNKDSFFTVDDGLK